MPCLGSCWSGMSAVRRQFGPGIRRTPLNRCANLWVLLDTISTVPALRLLETPAGVSKETSVRIQHKPVRLSRKTQDWGPKQAGFQTIDHILPLRGPREDSPFVSQCHHTSGNVSRCDDV